jgi:hypothetical protein
MWKELKNGVKIQPKKTHGVFINGQLRFYGFNDYHNMLITDFSPQQKYDMNISGSTDKASYYVSFGYLNKDGYIKMKDKNEKYEDIIS